jgi:two-component system, OmpR family, response regulator
MAAAGKRPKKVLVIDDDEQYLRLTGRLLRGAGYDVLTRSESIGTCAAVTAEDPDVVLIDVNMPSVDGDRLAPLIQRCTGVRPIVVLYSGMDVVSLQRRAKACGADAAIPKGLLPEQFLAHVARTFVWPSEAAEAERERERERPHGQR